MARPRQPIELIKAKGAKHLTKAEIWERENREVKPLTDNIIAPDYLTKKQKEQFETIVDQLERLKIMSETDVDAVSRYILSRDLYINLSKQLNKRAVLSDPELLDKYMKNQDRAFKQCRSSANDLGLTISSRCRLVIPGPKDSESDTNNKFKKFEKRVVGNE